MKKAKIGIAPLVDFEKESYWMLPGYMDSLAEFGAMPLMLPLTNNKELIEEIADEFDAFLFTGGHDVSPEMYGEEKSDKCGECCKSRDNMEKQLLMEILERDKPVLGICRGIQLINAVLGGTLYQDLPVQKPSNVNHHQFPPYDIPVHRVNIVKNTLLYNIIKKEELLVNSYHHQAVKTLSPLLMPMAYSSDGLIEAAAVKNKRFVLAVQWHPEFAYKTDENSRNIFKGFVNAAGSRLI